MVQSLNGESRIGMGGSSFQKTFEINQKVSKSFSWGTMNASFWKQVGVLTALQTIVKNPVLFMIGSMKMIHSITEVEKNDQLINLYFMYQFFSFKSGQCGEALKKQRGEIGQDRRDRFWSPSYLDLSSMNEQIIQEGGEKIKFLGMNAG